MAQDSLPPPNVRQAVPFLSVANMEASLRFYVSGLGFKMTKNWIVEGEVRWCWLEIGDAAVMLQQFPTEGRNSWRPSGKVGEGMIPKLRSCIDALKEGVARAHILDGRVPHALLLEFFTREGIGTMVTNEVTS